MSEPTLESLRAEGAERFDPVRFCYLEALAARVPAQPPAVQRVLEARLRVAVLDYAARGRAGAAHPPKASVQAAPNPASALARLNRDLQSLSRRGGDGGGEGVLLGGSDAVQDMPSVRRFSEVWVKLSAEKQVAQAFTRGPENAGPLNPHRLMLRSLALMRDLSPDYLQQFVSQMDSMLWLEQAATRPARAPLRAGRAGRSKS